MPPPEGDEPPLELPPQLGEDVPPLFGSPLPSPPPPPDEQENVNANASIKAAVNANFENDQPLAVRQRVSSVWASGSDKGGWGVLPIAKERPATRYMLKKV